MYEDSLLEMQYEDRFYSDDLEYERRDLDQDEDECADGHDLRMLNDDQDQCAECGTVIDL